MKLDQLQRWVSILMAGLLGFAALPVVAQDDDAGMQEEIEQIVVVGSRIPVSTPKDGTSPVQIVTAEEIARSGLTDLGALLQELPGAGSAINLTYNNGGDGSTRLDFRNLGTARTLILVDGRRWVAGGEGADGTVDINTIPLGAVERIEVLKDGASSIYGADAVAAVVNIVTRKNFDGALFSVSQGAFEAGGGESKKVEALFGIDGERGNITVGLTWVNKLAVGNWEREETSVRPSSGGSSGTPQGRFAYGNLAWPNFADNPNYVDNDNFLSADFIKQRNSNPLGTEYGKTPGLWGGAQYLAKFNGSGSFNPADVSNLVTVQYGNFANLPLSPENRGATGAVGFTPRDDGNNPNALSGTRAEDFTSWHGGANGWAFNYNPYNYVITPNERRSVFMRGNFEINDNHSATFKMLYQNRRSDQLLAPTPLFWGFNRGEGISASNAFNSMRIEFCDLYGSSSYGSKESCTQKAHYYYTANGVHKPVPDFYKEGDEFTIGEEEDVQVNYLYAVDRNGNRELPLYPIAANDKCAANGKPIGKNKSPTVCSRYPDSYLDKDGVVKYVTQREADGTIKLYAVTLDPSDPTGRAFTVSANPIAENTDIFQQFIAQDVAKKDKDGNVIYSNDNVPKPGYATGWFGRRMLEYGPRNFLQDIETFHVQAGAEGTFDVGTFEWKYDVDWSWSQVQAYIRTEGLFNTARIAQALGPSAENSEWSGVKAADTDNDNKVTADEATAYNSANNLTGNNAIAATDRFVLDDNGNIKCADSSGGCYSLNIFGGQGTNAQYLGNGLWGGSGSMTNEMLNYISFTAQDSGTNTQKLITANVAGSVVDLPAGPLGIAAGFEMRDTYGNDQPDALIAAGITSGNARLPTSGGYDVTEYYVEAKIPIVAGLPGVQLLDASISARSSDFSTFGTVTTDKIAVGWEINDMFKIRVTQGSGFRAPTINEQYLGFSDSYPEVFDPCAATVAGNVNDNLAGDFSQCAAAKILDRDHNPVPVGFDQRNDQIRITVGGNRNLQAEKSETFSYGVIIEPTDSMFITIDFWEIKITDAIGTYGPQAILDRCYKPGGAFYSPELCNLIERSPSGSVSDLIDVYTNFSEVNTNGYDIAIVYDINDQWRISGDATYVENISSVTGSGNSVSFTGLINGASRSSNPRVKGRLYTRFESEDGLWSWVNEFNYIHSVLFLGANGIRGGDPNDDRLLDATYYWDTNVRYNWDRINTTFLFGVENLLDQDPPYFPEAYANDFDPSYRMWGSQRWHVSLQHYID
ncbi:MAG: TonB-dependent receptor [Gammaproteobacteria bacterium AqS3]|nr:TonB-dependent receptor [Gammaproteobacteria bacterium AqS3]